MTKEESTECLLCAREFYPKNQKYSALYVLLGALPCCAGEMQLNAREVPDSWKYGKVKDSPIYHFTKFRMNYKVMMFVLNGDIFVSFALLFCNLVFTVVVVDVKADEMQMIWRSVLEEYSDWNQERPVQRVAGNLYLRQGASTSSTLAPPQIHQSL